MIMRKIVNLTLTLLAVWALVSIGARPAVAAQAAQQAGQQPAYTIPEYNAFQAANSEKDPQAKIKLLDDFVSKFPNSTLLQYVYQLYYQAYFQDEELFEDDRVCRQAGRLGRQRKADPTAGARLQARFRREGTSLLSVACEPCS